MTTINVKQRDTVRDALRAIKGMVILVATIMLMLIIFSLCTFTVGEGEQAAVIRFGTVTRVILDEKITFTRDNPDLMEAMSNQGANVRIEYTKGLHFKLPFVDQVEKYDSRLLTYISDEAKMNTNDKQQYAVTLYAQWRIANPALFYQVYHSLDRASIVMDDTIEPVLVQSINKLLATDFLSSKDKLNKSLGDSLKAMNGIVRSGGIEVMDVQVNRTLLPEANLQSTYDRMVANREKEAQLLRSQGQENYQNAKADADLAAAQSIATATIEAAKTRGEADAEALEIYAQAYSKDSEFYGYWRSLQALRNSLGHDATIVLDKNSPLWKDLWDMIQTGQITAK